jgi:hypothetical protein
LPETYPKWIIGDKLYLKMSPLSPLPSPPFPFSAWALLCLLLVLHHAPVGAAPKKAARRACVESDLNTHVNQMMFDAIYTAKDDNEVLWNAGRGDIDFRAFLEELRSSGGGRQRNRRFEISKLLRKKKPAAAGFDANDVIRRTAGASHATVVCVDVRVSCSRYMQEHPALPPPQPLSSLLLFRTC